LTLVSLVDDEAVLFYGFPFESAVNFYRYHVDATSDAETPDLEYALGFVRTKISRKLGNVGVNIVDVWTVEDESDQGYMLAVSRATRRRGPNVQLTRQQMEVIFQVAGGKDIVDPPLWQRCTWTVDELLELNPALMA
jgi:hypothetical protein